MKKIKEKINLIYEALPQFCYYRTYKSFSIFYYFYLKFTLVFFLYICSLSIIIFPIKPVLRIILLFNINHSLILIVVILLIFFIVFILMLLSNFLLFIYICKILTPLRRLIDKIHLPNMKIKKFWGITIQEKMEELKSFCLTEFIIIYLGSFRLNNHECDTLFNDKNKFLGYEIRKPLYNYTTSFQYTYVTDKLDLVYYVGEFKDDVYITNGERGPNVHYTNREIPNQVWSRLYWIEFLVHLFYWIKMRFFAIPHLALEYFLIEKVITPFFFSHLLDF